MQDREIRRILVEYLRIQHPDCRIYHEKYIGTAVCDLMLVTDRLTGFEIKSDSDNYERLSRQITAYDRFFDRNYIVVGRTHVGSIEERVPPYWGIYVIEEGYVSLLRKATSNRKVQAEQQLTMLWKLELKNLLIKNGLPLHAQKSKAFLSKLLLDHVAKDVLRRQIATELKKREQMRSSAQEDLSVGDGFPLEELMDRFSEEGEELTLDRWMAIYRMAQERKRQKQEQEQRLEQAYRSPRSRANMVPYMDISVTLGAPWISPEIVSQFAVDVLKVQQNYLYQLDPITKKYYRDKPIPIVQLEPLTGYWHVEKYKGRPSQELNALYGTARFNAMQILESVLNLRPIKIYDGSTYNQMETLAALEKRKTLQNAFEEWIWKSEARRREVEEAYHDLFGKYAPAVHDGSKLEFAGMNSEITLFDYQKDAVQQIIQTPNSLLAFDVGAGKTYIMIAAAMEMRRMGLSRKNMFVVPNNIVGQWEEMFLKLYPTAKVLAVDPKAFSPEKRKKVLEQMKNEDYDGIIIAYSCFEMIPLSSKVVMQQMHQTLHRFECRLQEVQQGDFCTATAPIQREMQHLQKTMGDLLSGIGDGMTGLTFDELEINTLFVDEAHNFKNLPLQIHLKQIRGINTKGSLKCTQMLQKVQFIQKANGGRGVVFATGTPLCNSISDAYAMQCYLQPEELQRTGLHRFDNWIKTFAKLEEVCEIDVAASGFRIVSRLKEFCNLPELSRMFGAVSIFHKVDLIGLPDFHGYDDVSLSGGLELRAYMQQLYARTEAIRTGAVDRKQDNMLKVSTDGRKAALSLHLVGKEQNYNETGKIWHCVHNVLKIYRQDRAYAQLIFCDYSTPKGQQYSVYRELSERLMEEGIPKREIAFIHDHQSEEKKLALYEAVNRGEVRVLIGSTFKLGIGANVQTKLKAIHHLDVPWRPADMVQREGRILRRGNENAEVFIYRYIVRGSFDAYSWQILQTKQHFISQFLSGSNTQRSIRDLEDEELDYAQVKALALAEPRMRRYVEVENQLHNARLLAQREQAQRETAMKELNVLIQTLQHAESHYAQDLQNATYIKDNLIQLVNESAEVLQYEGDRSVGDFAVCLQENKANLQRLGITYTVELGQSQRGNKQRMRNFFSRFDGLVDKRREEIAAMQERKAKLEQRINWKSDTMGKIAYLETALNDIFTQIQQSQN